MSFAEINSIKVHFVKKGSGKPILFIHGWNCSILFWKYNIDEFARHYTVYAIDLPGFGKSPASMREYSISEYTRLVLSFIKKMKIKNPVIIGHSMGGAIALELISRYYGKIKSLVLVDTLAKKVPSILRFLLIPYVGRLVHSLTLKNYHYLRYTDRVLFYNTKTYDDSVITEVMKTSQEASLRSLQSYAKTDFRKILNRIDIPVFVVVGKKTIISMRGASKTLAKSIKNSKLIVVSKAKHAPMLENPEEFNTMILSELAKI